MSQRQGTWPLSRGGLNSKRSFVSNRERIASARLALHTKRSPRAAALLSARGTPHFRHFELLAASTYKLPHEEHPTCPTFGVADAGPSARTWQADVSLGADTLTIAFGHVVDALRFVAGDFTRVRTLVKVQTPQWHETGTG